jgi:HlyD family secretion protein
MVVTPGTPLLEVGNSMDLEIVVDVLSSDAVKIAPGDEMQLVHWGGDESLSAKVRVVEPAAFTKISALGVEEQRVNVIGDFEGDQKNAGRLGDGYRIEAEIVIWKNDDVLQIPTSALFRTESEWCTFVIENGVVKKRVVKIGQRNELQAEVLSGLDPGMPVIIYPSDLVKEDVSVVPTIVTSR